MPKCRCGRILIWGKGFYRWNATDPVRVYYCPRCFKSSKECNCYHVGTLDEQLEELHKLYELNKKWKEEHK